MTLLAGLATEAPLFCVAAVLAGLCMGSSQSAGRALAGLFSPEQRRAVFYGLWTFATRLSAIIGPLTYGVVTLLTAGNHRIAILGTGKSSCSNLGRSPGRRCDADLRFDALPLSVASYRPARSGRMLLVRG